MEHDRLKATMDSLEHPIPPFWDVIPQHGYYERDNNMRHMISGHFYVSGRTNTVFHRLHQEALLVHDERNTPFEGRTRGGVKFNRASPQGMPRTAWEVRSLIRILCNEYSPHFDRILSYIFLREFFFIARSVTPSLRDQAMIHIMTPGIYDPNYTPERISPADLLPRFPDPGKPTGITNPGPERALNIDEMARYAILYGRPGPNFFTGVVMDYAFRVNRRSIFGYGLARLLAPEGKNVHFRRLIASIFALPRRYREAIEEYNRRNPSSEFTPQPGPTFTLHRLHSSHIPNMTMQTVIDLFLENRIPPSWVDHSYTFGLNFINLQYSASQFVSFYDEIDNERLERLRAYGVPNAIPEWDGWRHPTDDDVRRIRQLEAHRASREAPGYDHRRERGWTTVGEDGIFQNLTFRSDSAATRYQQLHPITLPSFPALDTVNPMSTSDTNMSVVDTEDANTSTVGPAPMDVEATATPVASRPADVSIESTGEPKTDAGIPPPSTSS
jgi:hypothetical protein